MDVESPWFGSLVSVCVCGRVISCRLDSKIDAIVLMPLVGVLGLKARLLVVSVGLPLLVTVVDCSLVVS